MTTSDAAEDRWLISNMISRYCELYDNRDFDAFARQFEYGQWRFEGMPDAGPGAQGLRDWMEQNGVIDSGTPGTKHVTTNLIIDVDGDAATARSYVTIFQVGSDLPLIPAMTGRYHDRFARVDGQWRWVERIIRSDRPMGALQADAQPADKA